MSKNKKARQYLIDLQKRRSVIAIIACAVTFGFCLFATGMNIVHYKDMEWEVSDIFRYFTTLSNMLTALAAAFIIPYAVNGIRKKRFVYPKWLAMFHYMGTIGTTITFLFVMIFILPLNQEFAVGGANLFLHVICPLAVLVSFFLVESGYRYTIKETFICLIPFFIYVILYLVMVVFLGKANGGWEDMYYLVTYVPPYVTLPIVLAFAWLVAFAIRKIYNTLSERRQRRILSDWNGSMEPVEIKIEVFGLGRYNGIHGEANDLSIPYDILKLISERYSLPTDGLVRAYTRGLTDGIEEKLAQAGEAVKEKKR